MAKKDTYIEGIGRRKTASARVRLTPADKTTFIINEKSLEDYFPYESLRKDVEEVLKAEGAGIENYTVSVHVKGSGIAAQADAIKLGIARALVKEKQERRSILKPLGFLKRDPRSVERKKFGLRKARRRPQFSKR